MKKKVTLIELALQNGFLKIGEWDSDSQEGSMEKGDIEIIIHNWHSGGYVGIKKKDSTYDVLYVSEAEEYLKKQ